MINHDILMANLYHIDTVEPVEPIDSRTNFVKHSLTHTHIRMKRREKKN